MPRPQILSAQETLEQIQGKVLLINPPVIDSRYPWIKWNQPLDLLKLGTALVQQHECEVKLFDFLLPTPKGTVPKRQSKIEVNLSSDEPIRWQFGQPWNKFDEYMEKLIHQNWIPDYVWITTLTSFWWQTVPLVANRIKNILKRPIVILYGNYPVLETQHTVMFCPNADIVVKDYIIGLGSLPADFSLYESQSPSFCALDLHCPSILDEIAGAISRNVSHFVFFNDNIFQEFATRLEPLLQEAVAHEWNIQFHGICGIQTRDFPTNAAQLFADAHFTELHFEAVYDEAGLIDESLYRSVMQACEKAGFVTKRGLGWESRRYDGSGFLWVGRPDDDLDKLVWNALKVLQLTGMVIPKPYSPTPGSAEHNWLTSKAGELAPQDISPHRLPFAGLNGIEKSDYEDFYRMTAFLNFKVRGHTFDFLGNTYLAQVIRDSLVGRKWDI